MDGLRITGGGQTDDFLRTKLLPCGLSKLPLQRGAGEPGFDAGPFAAEAWRGIALAFIRLGKGIVSPLSANRVVARDELATHD